MHFFDVLFLWVIFFEVFFLTRQYLGLFVYILLVGDDMGRHMSLKNPKRRRRFWRMKVFIFLFFIYIGFSATFYYSVRRQRKISNEEFINLLVSTGNANILSRYQTTNLVNATMKFLFQIDFRNPKTILNSSILRYVGGGEEKKKIQLEYNDDYSNMEELKGVSDYIEDPNPSTQSSPIIYLYNSHQLENYANHNLDIYGITPNVMMASYVLRENLSKLGISSLVEETNMSDVLASKGWNYSRSYDVSRISLLEKKKQYTSLKYFIDLHRDSVDKKYTTTQIGDKNYAKILFVVGQDYSGWEENYRVALSMNQMFDRYYPGLSRGIMLKTGLKVNGVYNQDVSVNTLLFEVGGVDNDIEEVYHTVSAMADVLARYVKGER